MSKAKGKKQTSSEVEASLKTKEENDGPVIEPNEDEDDEEEDAENPVTQKDKKKKKKKKGGEKKETTSSAPISAAGRAILERQRQIAEEEARINAQKEEEERKIREEEEKEAARLREIEEEKERKRKAKVDKIERQKKEGTYMTKSEKEKQKKMQARLESMKAAGGIQIAAIQKSEKPVEASLKKLEKEETPISSPVIETSAPVSDVLDSWEDEDEDTVDILPKVASLRVEEREEGEEEEDMLTREKRLEQQRLKQLGLERSKREEEARLKREAEEHERAEMERKEREAAMLKERSRQRRREKDAAAMAARSPDRLRSPISVIMGHVDTGKTKLLDKIRHTNVQEGEAGGITQQIGATQFSRDTLSQQTHCMQTSQPFDIRIPGLLMIDTPGHEAFSNLRNRGSSLCDIAILVVDLMHGLEPQTIESLKMLQSKKAHFIVALNKVDRLYGWKKLPDGPILEALALQDENCMQEFRTRSDQIILQLNELGFNAKLYWENDEPNDTLSLVPTSAMSGEGVPDLLRLLIVNSQTFMEEKLMYVEKLQCTVLEVKVIEGLGTSIDVVLVNGTLREGDKIVVSTMDGPVVTSVRALLTPPPNREMRIKSEYIHHEYLQGAIGVKVVATDIGRAVAGTPLLVVEPEDDEADIMEEVQSDLSRVMKALETSSRGVMVHASTLGALEALLQFLREECKPPIPVGFVNIGPIYKKDVMRAAINNEKGLPQFATILAFDVKVDAEAAAFAAEENVKIFTAEIIYHLFDQFSAHMRAITETKRAAADGVVVFPCTLKILPQHIFNRKDPIVFGVEVLEGTLKLNTPLYIPSLKLDVGKVISIENNRKEVTSAKKGTSVSVRITNESNPTITFGRQFDQNHTLYSKLSRASIDALKEFYKEEVSKEEWALVVKLKKLMNISDATGSSTSAAKATAATKASEKAATHSDYLIPDSEDDDDDEDS